PHGLFRCLSMRANTQPFCTRRCTRSIPKGWIGSRSRCRPADRNGRRFGIESLARVRRSACSKSALKSPTHSPTLCCTITRSAAYENCIAAFAVAFRRGDLADIGVPSYEFGLPNEQGGHELSEFADARPAGQSHLQI